MRRRVAALGAVLALPLALQGVTAAAGPPLRERELYLLHCSGCHAAEGVGVPGVAPSLHGIGWILEAEGGRDYVAAVPGVAQAPIPDAELAALLDHVFLRFSGTAPEPPFDAAGVGAARRTPLRDPLRARTALGPPLPAR